MQFSAALSRCRPDALVGTINLRKMQPFSFTSVASIPSHAVFRSFVYCFTSFSDFWYSTL